MCMGSPIDAYSWPAQYPIRISPYLQVFFGIIGVCILVTTIACVTIVVTQKTVAYARFRQKWDQVPPLTCISYLTILMSQLPFEPVKISKNT